jgi:acetyl-CoA synthetase
MSSIVYRPEAPWIQRSHVYQFMTKLGFDSFDALLRYSQEDTERFWQKALEDIQLTWTKPYQKLLASGLPWPKWAEGGEISVAENCIDRHLKTNPNKPALIFEADLPGQSVTWSFQDLALASSLIAQQLKDKGAKPGDRAALLMPMSLEMVACFFGIFRAGLTAIPIFSGYGEEAIAARLQDAQVKFVCVQEETTRRGKPVPVKETLSSILKDCPSVKHILTLNRSQFTSKQGFEKQQLIPSHSYPSEAECLLLYTSGTTGKPKACVHTPFGVLATTGKELRYGFDVHSDDRFFWYTDIGWMMGPWELLGVLQFGSTVVLYEGVPDFPEPDRLWKIIDQHQVTHLGISPTAVRVLKKAGDQYINAHSLDSLRILGSTGEPWDEETWTWYFEKVGKSRCPIQNISGGTEIMGCHLMPSLLKPLKPTTLGGPALGVRAEVWNESGESLSKGLGHLVCKSPAPAMTKGFLNARQKYLDTYFEKFGPSTWYHGDWAFIDDDGFWFLRGRSDDTIKIAGKRVGPNEFESALMEHSAVAESAAVGIPHEIKGESVICFVVLKDRTQVSENLRAELMTQIVKTMGKALAADKVLFVEALPKTRSGKILRGIIRKIFLNEAYDSSAADQPAALEAVKHAL